MKLARILGVAAILLLPPFLLMPRALLGGWYLSSADALFTHYRPWQGRPPDGFQGARSPQAAETAFHFDPNMEFADRSLRAGRLPTWNPYNGFGEPFLGHARVGAMNPLDVLRFILPPESSKAWRTALWLFLAGWFTFRLLRLLGLHSIPALGGAVIYEMNGFHLSWILFPHLRCAVLLPLCLWMGERLLRRPDCGRAAWTALAVGLVFLADHPETGMLVLLTSLTFGLLRGGVCIRVLGGFRRVTTGWIWLLIAHVLGALIGWIQIHFTVLDGSWLAMENPPCLPVSSFLGLFAPGLFGPPSGNWWGPMHPMEGVAYLGILPLLAALLAVISSFFQDGRVRTFALLAFLGGLAAMVAPRGFQGESFLSLGGLPFHRMTLSMAMAGAVLAALGLQRVLPLAGIRPLGRSPFLIATGVVLLGLIVSLCLYVHHHMDVSMVQAWKEGGLSRLLGRVAIALVLTVTGVRLLAALRFPGAGRLLRAAPLLFILLDLGFHGQEYVGEIPCRYDLIRPRAIEGLSPGARVVGQGFVLPPQVNLGFGYRDVRGMRSGEVPAMAELLKEVLPSDPDTGMTRAGPWQGLEKLGIDAWFSDKPLGPEGVRLEVGGQQGAIKTFPLLVNRPVRHLTIHTSVAEGWTLEAGTQVALLTVVGEGREVKVPLRAGIETGDWALKQYAYFARHPRPEASGSWTVHDSRGDPYPRHCYPVMVELDPPFTPHGLRFSYSADRGWLNLHQVMTGPGTSHGFEWLQTLGPEVSCHGVFRRPVRGAGPDHFLSPGYRLASAGESMGKLLAMPHTIPSSQALLDRKPDVWTGSDGADGMESVVTCTRVDICPGKFRIQVPGRKTSTVLVIRESYHPDWTAVDPLNEPVSLESVDTAFLGAVLPPGPALSLLFSYHPRALTTGLWVLSAALLLVLLFLVVGFKARCGAFALPEDQPGPGTTETSRSEPGPEEPHPAENDLVEDE